MKDNYKKINGLRDFILGWIHKEACNDKSDKEVLQNPEEYDDRKSKLNMLAGPDIEYINKLKQISRQHWAGGVRTIPEV